MPFSREGWKSQKLLQVCCDCLSRRTPVRRLTSVVNKTTIEPKLNSKLLDQFRTDLYQQTKMTDTKYSPLVRKAIARREERQRLMTSYRELKKSASVSALTQHDVDELINKLKITHDASFNQGPCQDAFDILQDVRKGKLAIEFRQQDLEYMIYLSTELKWTKKSLALLTEATELYENVDISCFEAVFNLVSTKQQHTAIERWLNYLEEKGVKPTRSMMKSMVLCDLNDLDKAAKVIRKYGSSYGDVSQLINKYSKEENRELVDHALNIFAMDCLKGWRLNDMRYIYLRKRQFGMSTTIIVKNLMDKSVYTGQIKMAELLLLDTMKLQDMNNIQTCCRKLIQYYLNKGDIKHSVQVWQLLEKNGYLIERQVLYNLLLQSSKLKYHTDTIKIYQRYMTLYPQHIDHQLQVSVLKCTIRSKDFRNAYNLQEKIQDQIQYMKPPLARIAIQSLFSLSAQTGNIELFERVFNISEKLKLSLTHKGLTSLVACYLKRGDVRSAKAAFQSVASHTDGPDVVDFNLLMRTVVMEDKGIVNYDKIFDILQHMNLVNVTPDETTMRTMLRFYTSESDMQKSLYDKLLTNPEAASRFNQVYLNNLAFKSLLTRSSVEDVVGILMRNNRSELFPKQENERIHVNGMTYNILFHKANQSAKYSSISEKLLKDMESRGMKPSVEIYQDLIKNLAKKGKIAKARKYIEKMESDTGEKCTLKTWNYLVDGLISLSKPNLAKEIILKDINIPLDDRTIKKLNKL